MGDIYLTTAIPYVNADPHLGHALELVQADVLARHRRLRGQSVRFLTGTDDNALKNVTAAGTAGIPVRDFVDRNAQRFQELREVLDLSFDDFIRTSTDVRHRVGVARLWRRCRERGDFYKRHYTGLYCNGCEQFYDPDELQDGRCPEHATEAETVREENWFFRLSKYAGKVLDVIESGRVRIEPENRRNEVIAFVRSGLEDLSVSRPARRAGGWGIPVPEDPEQVVYVWWDALANYVTALGYGTDDPLYDQWWVNADERIHVVGKGIIRFHAVYWVALLLSADLPLPDRINVHEYLTVDGAKISKSAGNAVSPEALVGRFGSDAVRWWLVRDVARLGDTDFTVDRLIRKADGDLANGIGNLQSRVLGLLHRYRGGRAVLRSGGGPFAEACEALPETIDTALERFDFRTATEAILAVVAEGNRLVETQRPWELAAREAAGDRLAGEGLDDVLAQLVHGCRVIAAELQPFIPHGAHVLASQLEALRHPVPVFPRHRGR